MKHATLILICTQLLLSCSVKEDRTGCPCILEIDMGGIEADEAAVLSIWGSRLLSQETVLPLDFPEGYEKPVDKGYNTVSALCGKFNTSLDRQRFLTIPEGKDFDRIFAHVKNVECTGEYAFDTLNMTKQFCVLDLVMLNPGEDQYGYTLELESNTSAMDIFSLSGIQGHFHCCPEQIEEDTYRSVLPRQTDNSLMLTLYGKNHDAEKVLHIGEYINRSGYSWTTPSLDDITIRIDYASGQVTVTVRDWETGKEQDCII